MSHATLDQQRCHLHPGPGKPSEVSLNSKTGETICAGAVENLLSWEINLLSWEVGMLPHSSELKSSVVILGALAEA